MKAIRKIFEGFFYFSSSKQCLAMDSCLVDVTIEFLAVAFHSILYYAAVYPKSIYETRRKYNVVVYRSIHPEVNSYIDMSLKSIAECLKSGQMKRIEFAVTNNKYESTMKFIFDIDKCDKYDETSDSYLVQAEENIRAFCLNLSNMSSKFKTPDDASFSIYLHTTQSSAVSLATNPDLEDFPLVQVEEQFEESNGILPLRRFTVRDHNFDTYIEMNC